MDALFQAQRRDTFAIDKRGARGTMNVEHKAESIVRTGHTFQRVVFIPNWREDFTPDEVYRTRRLSRMQKPKTIMEK